MRIHYEEGLEGMARALEEYGHELFPANVDQPCDAVLYKRCMPAAKAGPRGALYVYAGSRSPDDLNQILRSRLYGKLF